MKSALTKEQKRQFNSLIYAAQESEMKFDLVESLKYYESALKLLPNHKKLPLKIKQIKDKIEKSKSKVDPKTANDISGFVYNTNQNKYFLNGGFWLSVDIFNKLLPHQRTGIKWLWEHHNETKIHGCILGDDMGLGKTVEILAFVLGLTNNSFSRTFLIVVPAMVALQWQTEAKKWCPPVTLYSIHHMSPPDRRAAISSIQINGGILLTTYNLVQNDEANLGVINWDYIILDEAHTIKSRISKASSVLKSFKAKHKIAATGTPMMNNLLELWNIMDFTTDGALLGNYSQFQSYFERIISNANLRNEKSPFAKRRLLELSKRIGPYILRRTKKDVFGDDRPTTTLTPHPQEKDDEEGKNSENSKCLTLTVNKYELIVWVKLDSNQKMIYTRLLRSINMSELKMHKVRTIIGMISYLEKSCSNPPAIKDVLEDQTKPFIDNEIIKMVDEETINLWPKLTVLLKLLKMCEKTNEKVLLFSQYQRTLDSISDLLQSKDILFLRIDGDLDDGLRKERLRRFNHMSSWGVLLMTIRVGACGLNITGASRVVIFDEGWSTIGNQAVDRAYRIGQKKDVVTYRIVSCGTVEEKMYRRQVHKTTLTELTLETNQEKQRFRHWFTKKELYTLFDSSQVNFDNSETHLIFKQYKPLYPQNMPEYPDWLDNHIKEIEKVDNVFGVSDHSFIIKTDIPDELVYENIENEQEEKHWDFDKKKDGSSIGGTDKQRKNQLKTKIEVNIIDDTNDFVNTKTLPSSPFTNTIVKRRKDRSTACYGHISKANPFLVKKCRCFLNDNEKKEYNDLVEQLKECKNDEQRLLCLLQLVNICDDDIHLHENIALLAQKYFK
ncbi:DNA repair and recombination protein RAD54B, putative [Entamoeba dispar SAW760]|uniref:DNA repair and recombination protein RAD54B, putative n=1 Tax=Entamoeba dispar (strain ATCC PRA-260 / SAW760) TaxID=370354 RepID=B0EUD5_ENTDS|nr:DNA repair and recombination protein RAD54B, putative [Entamoeba dispar SAW760]EDR21860.1 DNA repair and recombination protein RAD54B, putative [Entamoeba dispar SAW760]|eukprot:EDR21860.1 DNA repair and recombination protein RAD54B, putative [Entamoeba dispar SAW760]